MKFLEVEIIKIKLNSIWLFFHSSTETKTDIFTDDELRNASYCDDLKDYETVELFLDFKANSYSNVDEVFTVKVKLEQKEKEEDDSGLSKGTIAGLVSVVASIGISALTFYCFYLCCCKKEVVVKEKRCCSIF